MENKIVTPYDELKDDYDAEIYSRLFGRSVIDDRNEWLAAEQEKLNRLKPQPVATPNPAEEKPWYSGFIPERSASQMGDDASRSVLSGFAGLGKDALFLADHAGRFLYDEFLGDIDSQGNSLRSQSPKFVDDAKAKLSDIQDYNRDTASDISKAEHKAVADAKGFFPTVGAYAKHPSAIAGDILESAAPSVVGGVATKLASGMAGLWGLTGKALEKFTAGAGLTSIGLLEGSDAGVQAEENVSKMTPLELMQHSPDYANSVKQLVSSGMSEADAQVKVQKQMANDAGITAFALNVPLAVLASKLTGAGKLESDFYTGNHASGFIGSVAKEGLEETAQGASGQFSQNVATMGSDDRVNPMDDVSSAAAQGLVVGVGQSGGMKGVDIATSRLAGRGSVSPQSNETIDTPINGESIAAESPQSIVDDLPSQPESPILHTGDQSNPDDRFKFELNPNSKPVAPAKDETLVANSDIGSIGGLGRAASRFGAQQQAEQQQADADRYKNAFDASTSYLDDNSAPFANARAIGAKAKSDYTDALLNTRLPENMKDFRLLRSRYSDHLRNVANAMDTHGEALNKEPDSLLQYAAKNGGLNADAWAKEGVDPADAKVANSGFAKAFRKNGGMTPDDLAEFAHQNGFAGFADKNGNLDANAALNAVNDELSGNKRYSSQDEVLLQAAQNAPAYASELKGMGSPEEIKSAISKALAGEKLGARQVNIVQTILDSTNNHTRDNSSIQDKWETRARTMLANRGQKALDQWRNRDEHDSDVTTHEAALHEIMADAVKHYGIDPASVEAAYNKYSDKYKSQNQLTAAMISWVSANKQNPQEHLSYEQQNRKTEPPRGSSGQQGALDSGLAASSSGNTEETRGSQGGIESGPSSEPRSDSTRGNTGLQQPVADNFESGEDQSQMPQLADGWEKSLLRARPLAKKLGIPNYNQMRLAELVPAINAHYEAQQEAKQSKASESSGDDWLESIFDAPLTEEQKAYEESKKSKESAIKGAKSALVSWIAKTQDEINEIEGRKYGTSKIKVDVGSELHGTDGQVSVNHINEKRRAAMIRVRKDGITAARAVLERLNGNFPGSVLDHIASIDKKMDEKYKNDPATLPIVKTKGGKQSQFSLEDWKDTAVGSYLYENGANAPYGEASLARLLRGHAKDHAAQMSKAETKNDPSLTPANAVRKAYALAKQSWADANDFVASYGVDKFTDAIKLTYKDFMAKELSSMEPHEVGGGGLLLSVGKKFESDLLGGLPASKLYEGQVINDYANEIFHSELDKAWGKGSYDYIKWLSSKKSANGEYPALKLPEWANKSEPKQEAQKPRPSDGVSVSVAQGIDALEKVIAKHEDVKDAVVRSDIGGITFVWGKVGNPSKGFAGGYGISKIIAKRNSEGKNGEEIARKLVDVIVNGEAAGAYGPENGKRINIKRNGHTAVVSLMRDGNKEAWLLTGWEDNESDGAEKVNSTRTYASESSGIKTQKGADESSIDQHSSENQSESEGISDAERESLVNELNRLKRTKDFETDGSRYATFFKRIQKASAGDADAVKWANEWLSDIDAESKVASDAEQSQQKADTEKADAEKTQRDAEKESRLAAFYRGEIPDDTQPVYAAWVNSLSEDERHKLFAKDSSGAARNAAFLTHNKGHDIDKPHYQRPESEVKYQSELPKRLRDGEVSIDEFKAAFDSLTSDRESMESELSKLTKDKLINLISGYSAIRAKSEKKAYAVRAAYESLITQYYYAASNSGMFSYSGNNKDYIQGKIDAVKPFVDAATQNNLDAYAKDYLDARKEQEIEKALRDEGVSNPKSLDDFKSLHQSKLDEIKAEQGLDRENVTADHIKQARMAMRPEQRAEYDRLLANESKDKRKSAKANDKTRIVVADESVTGDIVETKHTKHGHDLFVVQLHKRVERDDYNKLNASAKKLGGHYSSFKGNGAVVGFQFKSRDDAEAFLQLAGGDSTAAAQIAKEKRDAFEDDKSQSTVERLRTMASALDEQADQEINRDRKANTHRRAGIATRALEAAERDKAFAGTMNKIAEGIELGKLQFLEGVRTKTQLQQLIEALRMAKSDEIRSQYDNYSDQIKHKNDPVTQETADHANWPTYTAYRSDLAKLARQLIETEGLKKLGNELLKIADDTSKEYLSFAKENIHKVARFTNKEGGLATFKTKTAAAESILKSGFSGQAIPFEVKRGEHIIILSASESMRRGIWEGSDKKITLNPSFAQEIVEKAAAKNRKSEMVSVPWQFETVYDRRQRYAAMGIETPAEFRSALRELASLMVEPKEIDNVKKLEMAMVGRKQDGLDFFPTPQALADEMINVAGIQAGMNVLEPSAGMGHIADRIRAFGVEPDVVEISSERRELLEAKGYNLVGNDFTKYKNRDTFGYGDTFRAEDGTEGILRGQGGLGSDRVRLVDESGEGVGKKFFSMSELTPVKKNGAGSGYDRIIMNPPFSDRRDMEHVLHAYDLLKPGGRIVAIVGEGVMFGSDKKATEFRDWLERLGATAEKLEEGTFNDPSLPVTTGVNARMLVIDKPESGEIKYSLSNQEKKSIPIAESQAVIDKLKADWKGHADVRVVDSLDDLPSDVRKRLDADGKTLDNVQGIFHPKTGIIYLNANKITSKQHAKELVFHEAYTHLGLSNLFGNDVTAIMGRLYLAMGGQKGINELAAKHGIDLSKYETLYADERADYRNAVIAEELLAHMAEHPRPRVVQLVKELIGAIRAWLRKNGFAELASVNDDDIAHLLKQSRETITKGKGSDTTGLIYTLSGMSKSDRRAMNESLKYSVDDLPEKTRNEDLISLWKVISRNKDSFQLPQSHKKDFVEIAKDLEGDKGFKAYEADELAEMNKFKADRAWRVVTPKGEKAAVFQKGDSVWIDVSDLTAGDDGKRIYNMVANYAFNNNKVFKGDPAGLSVTAKSRRLENMLSSALKFGTTDHLQPHKLQLVSGNGVPGLKWKKGDTENNIIEMIRSSYEAVKNQFPEIENLVYNPETDKIENRISGREYSDKDLYKISDRKRSGQDSGLDDGGGSSEDGAKITAGRSTIARAVLTGSILRGTSGERSAILAKLGNERSERLTGDNAILYSLDNNQTRSGGFSASDLQEHKNTFGISIDGILRVWQDKMRPLLRTQNAIKKSGGTVSESQDAYGAEEAFHGKTENDLRKMRERFLEPMSKKMADNNIEREELDMYLWAKHAEERNAQIAKINEDMPDGGSGMTNAQAKQILQQAKTDGKDAVLSDLADTVYKLLAEKRKIARYLSGDDVVDTWNNTYKYYVPLKGRAVDDSGGNFPRVGKGFDIRGKESLRALGRRTKPESPTLHAIKDTTEAIIRYRKNEVGNALLSLIEANPNPEYWEVYDASNPDFERKLLKKAGKEYVGQAKVINKDDYFITKRDGKEFYIHLEDPLLMRAMKNMGPEKMNWAVQHLAKASRFLSAMCTSYNPEFVVTNFARDIQTAIINLQAEIDLHDGKAKGKQITSKMIKGVPSAMRSVYASLNGKKLTGELAEWQKSFDDFRNDGANTGWYQLKDIDQQAKELETLINSQKKSALGFALRLKKSVGGFVENTNGAVENAIRLSVYKNAVDAGVSRKQAASLAKNLTVNFNRKGEIGATMNALFMFFNASMQGTASLARALGTLKVDDNGKRSLNAAQKVALGVMVTAFGLAVLNRSGAGDDDDGENWWDKVPTHEKERNIIIMKSTLGGPKDGTYWKIPMPYGYNIFNAMAVSAEGAVNGKKGIGQASGEILKATMGAFSPIGVQDSKTFWGGALRTIAPTVTKPIADLATNENFFGSKIFAENMDFDTPKPDSHLSMRSTNIVWKWLAEALNDNTGGSAYRSGLIDLSPDKMGYIFNYFVGSAGAFYSSAVHDGIKLAEDRNIETKEIPFARKLSGSVDWYKDQVLFYERKDELEQILDEYKNMKLGAEKVAYFEAHKNEIQLAARAKTVALALSHVRKKKNKINDNEDLTDKQKDEALDPLDARMKESIDRFNLLYSKQLGR